MLVLKNISIFFGERALFNALNWTVKPGEKIALVGRNGVGKTTLLRAITGQRGIDTGSVEFPRGVRIGLLEQDIGLFEGHTVQSLALSAFPELEKQSNEWTYLEKEISHCQDENKIMDLSVRMSDLSEEMTHAGTHQKMAETEKVLKGLGFLDSDMNRPVSEFSGGWRMRILLARLLLMKPDYLLLDEPTNHLDIVSVIWLENYLKEYSGTYIVISHDRRFLNEVATKVADLDEGKIKIYAGNYDKYLELREEHKAIMMNTYKNQQSEIERKERLIDKYRAKASKASMAKALASELARMDRVEIDRDENRAMNLRFPAAPRSAERVFEGMDMGMRYGDNQVFSGIDFNILRGQKVSLIGQNGQGKTTLARIITNDLLPTEGSHRLGSNVIMRYFAQDQGEQIDGDSTVLNWLENQASPEMRSKVRKVLGAFLFSKDDVDKKVKVLSGGERSRLALASIVLQPINFLILDEPTNHLDMQSKDVLKEALRAYDGALLVISHDREFLHELTEFTTVLHDGRITDHIGDVDSFLRQGGFESLVDFSINSDQSTKATEPKPEVSRIDPNKRKQIERNIKKVEREIESVELKQKSLEAVMASDGFFEKEGHKVQLDEYNANRSMLNGLNDQWEELVIQLDEV
jgi:ATP-binding cassette subfamily F protein 3